MVIDSQDDYSTALARRHDAAVPREGVQVTRQSVSNTETDFSSIVTNVSSSTRSSSSRRRRRRPPTRSRTSCASRARRRSCSAPTARTRRASTSRGSATSRRSRRTSATSRPTARSSPATRSSHPARRGAPSGRRRTSPAGSLMDAIRKACADGQVNRGEVVRQVRTTNLPSILSAAGFASRRRAMPAGVNWYFFRITNGKYTYVA